MSFPHTDDVIDTINRTLHGVTLSQEAIDAIKAGTKLLRQYQSLCRTLEGQIEEQRPLANKARELERKIQEYDDHPEVRAGKRLRLEASRRQAEQLLAEMGEESEEEKTIRKRREG